MLAHRSVACGETQTSWEPYDAFKAFVAAIVHPPRISRKCLPFDCDINWPRPDVCLLLAFHLDDEPNLRASIVQLVKVVQDARQSSIIQRFIYGVLFDVWNCCIVKIHPDGHVVAHTGCLQFLPDLRLDKNPHTPGITAIGRLFCRPGSDLFRGIARRYKLNPQKPESFSSRLPPEIVRHIASYLSDLETVVSLSLVSETWARDVEADYWNYAVINDRYRLLKALPWDPSKQHLASATFEAFDFQTDTVVGLRISHTVKVDHRTTYHNYDKPNEVTMLDVTVRKERDFIGDIHLIRLHCLVHHPLRINIFLRVDLEGTGTDLSSDDEDE